MQAVTNRGFTLFEVLMVGLILSLLLILALPAYQDTVLRVGRGEGRQLLQQVLADQQRYYAVHQQYSADAEPFAEPTRRRRQSVGGRYEVSIRACEGESLADCVQAVATPLANQQADRCGLLSLNSRGQRGAADADASDCW